MKHERKTIVTSRKGTQPCHVTASRTKYTSKISWPWWIKPMG